MSIHAMPSIYTATADADLSERRIATQFLMLPPRVLRAFAPLCDTLARLQKVETPEEHRALITLIRRVAPIDGSLSIPALLAGIKAVDAFAWALIVQHNPTARRKA